MLSVLAFLSLAQAPLTVTYEAMPLYRMLPQLSEKVGIRLVASPDVRNEVLVLRVNSAPWPELQARIAAVCHAEWRAEPDGTLVLHRPPAKQKEERAFELAYLRKDLGDAVQELLDMAEKPKQRADWETLAKKLRARLEQSRMLPTYYSQGDEQNDTPSQRLAIRLLAQLPLEELVLLPGQRKVYSNAPTRMQLKFPGEWERVLSRFVDEQNAWAEVVEGLPDPPKSNFENPFSYVQRVDGKAARFLLIVGRGNSRVPVHLRFVVLDEQNKTVGKGGLALTTPRVRKQIDLEQVSGEANEEPVKLSEKTQKFLALVQVFMGRGGARPSLGELAPFLKTEEIDPLALGPSEALIQLAERRGVNLVANLPDYYAALLTFVARGQGNATLTPEQFIGMADGITPAVVKSGEGWLTMQPQLPSEARWERIDRPELDIYLRALSSETGATLADRARFALHGYLTPYDGLAPLYTMMADESGGANTADQSILALRFYGSLPDHQVQALNTGQTLTFAGLSSEQRKRLQDLVYGERAGWSVRGRPNLNPDLHFEATEVLPGGLPSSGTIQPTSRSEVLLIGEYDTPGAIFSRPRFLTPQWLAELIHLQKNPQDNREGFEVHVPDRVKVASKRTLGLIIDLGGGYSQGVAFSEVKVDRDAKAVKIEQLPEDVRKLIVRGGGGS